MIGRGEPFPGAAVDVSLVALTIGTGPGTVPPSGIDPKLVLELPLCPLGTPVTREDVELVRRIRNDSVPLGEFCLVDTGVVAHRPGGSREELLFRERGEGRVPYADAKEFFDGAHRWLSYEPDRMHRAKTPSMFENPKIVIQRIRGRRPMRAAIDDKGIFLGHTCTIVQPRDFSIPLSALLDLMCSPFVDAVMRIERGQTLDLYPREVAGFPVPNQWFNSPDLDFATALSLNEQDQARLKGWVGEPS